MERYSHMSFVGFIFFALSFHNTDKGQKHGPCAQKELDFCFWLADLFHCLFVFTNLCGLLSFPLWGQHPSKQMMPNCFTWLQWWFSLEFILSVLSSSCCSEACASFKRSSSDIVQIDPPKPSHHVVQLLFFFLQIELRTQNHAIRSQFREQK